MAIAVASAGLAQVAAQSPAPGPAGMAWKVQGEWSAKGQTRPLGPGDPVQPGSLVRPLGLDRAHSLLVLLPDGQRLLYECFTPEDCARGFRVPALVERPSPFAVDMLARMRTTVASRAALDSMGQPQAPAGTRAALDEAVAIWDGGAAVPVGGLLAALPDGTYTYVLQAVHPSSPQQERRTLQKSGGTCLVPVPGAGLYDVVVSDAQGTQRVDMFIAAIAARHSKVLVHYKEAKDLLNAWNAKYSGWPDHELLRAYLESWSGGSNGR